jgi:hypothetical protein
MVYQRKLYKHAPIDVMSNKPTMTGALQEALLRQQSQEQQKMSMVDDEGFTVLMLCLSAWTARVHGLPPATFSRTTPGVIG